MHTGAANLPLHYGKCPPWLFQRMKPLAAAIIQIIVEEFGPQEVLRRLSDPIWFQAFGSVLGFDWHSSGLTTTVCGALKEGLQPRQKELGIFFAGGKGRTSRGTPAEIEQAGEKYGLPADTVSLQYASRMAAKVDSAAVQDGYQIYHHFFVFTGEGEWAVVQQGMNGQTRWARRYHWLNTGKTNAGGMDFVREPHAAVCGDHAAAGLNMVAGEADRSREVSALLAREKPELVLKELDRISRWSNAKNAVPRNHADLAPSGVQLNLPLDGEGNPLNLPKDPRTAKESRGAAISPEWMSSLAAIPEGAPSLTLPAPHWVPNASRLDQILRATFEEQPRDFATLLATPGVGTGTVRALALVAEVTYGARASFRDPVRYSFAHGGKDGHPFPVDRPLYDQTIETLEDALRRAKLDQPEKLKALQRLAAWRGNAQA